MTFPQRLLCSRRCLLSLCSVQSREARSPRSPLSCSGWIAALSELREKLAVGIIMMVVAGFFTLCAVLSLLLLKQVSGSEARQGLG